MTRKYARASLLSAVAVGMLLSACKDTKTLQENEQLKNQVAELQKENGQLGNNLETVTAARDELQMENATLKAELKAKNPKHAAKTKKGSRKKHPGI